MCTHLLHEAEGIADHLVLLEDGEVRTSGNPEALTKRYMPDPIVIIDAEDTESLRFISELDGVLDIRYDGALHVTLDSVDRVPDIVIEAVKRGVRPTRVEPLTPTLEDLYFEMQRTHRGEQ
jgi:ABC-2 type transport system ATP-binding protein